MFNSLTSWREHLRELKLQLELLRQQDLQAKRDRDDPRGIDYTGSRGHDAFCWNYRNQRRVTACINLVQAVVDGQDPKKANEEYNAKITRYDLEDLGITTKDNPKLDIITKDNPKSIF